MNAAPAHRTLPQASVARVSRWLVLASALLALAPPLAVLGGGLALKQREAEALAQSIAAAAARDGVTAARDALERVSADAATDRDTGVELTDARGNLVARTGPAPRSSVALARAVQSTPTATATVRVTLPVHGVLWLALAAAALSLAACGLGWQRVLQRSLGTLQRTESQLSRLSIADPLTGLLNRAGLMRRLERRMRMPDRDGRRPALVLIDLDRFRVVNESLGQPMGDSVLRAVGERIRQIIGSGSAAARISADQFAVQLDAVAGAAAARAIATNLLRALAPEIEIDGQTTQVSVSIGIALGDGSSDAPDRLLARADAAMRAAKAGGGARYRLFDESMVGNMQRRLQLDVGLRRALHEERFELAFQPIFAAGGKAIVAVEALLRWNDPQQGPVSPAEFVPILEENGLIVPVGQWVLREACRTVRRWFVEGATPVVLSVNVSPLQFGEAGFVRTLAAVLDETGFPPGLLQLEVTEGLLLDPTPESLRKMDEIADRGIRIAIDDFGMGYSSLVYLKRFRLGALKIDRLFVHDLLAHERNGAIVRAIVELGHALQLHVTAEGVENAAQHERLVELGCDSLQGFHFSRPVPAEAMRGQLLAATRQSGSGDLPSDWSTTFAASLEATTTR